MPWCAGLYHFDGTDAFTPIGRLHICAITRRWPPSTSSIRRPMPCSTRRLTRPPTTPAGPRAVRSRVCRPGRRRPHSSGRRFCASGTSLILEDTETLARMMTQEMGKPITESRGEVKYAAAFVEWYAEEAKRAYGDIVPTHAANKRLLVTRQPVGPVYAVTPWNFPAAMVTRKVAPALAAGCTVVLKPAEQSPLTAIRLQALVGEGRRAGRRIPGDDNVGSRGRVGRVLRRRARAQADVHRQHRGRHQAVREGGADREARVARAWRARAVHHFRRRRHPGGRRSR